MEDHAGASIQGRGLQIDNAKVGVRAHGHKRKPVGRGYQERRSKNQEEIASSRPLARGAVAFRGQKVSKEDDIGLEKTAAKLAGGYLVQEAMHLFHKALHVPFFPALQAGGGPEGSVQFHHLQAPGHLMKAIYILCHSSQKPTFPFQICQPQVRLRGLYPFHGWSQFLNELIEFFRSSHEAARRKGFHVVHHVPKPCARGTKIRDSRAGANTGPSQSHNALGVIDQGFQSSQTLSVHHTLPDFAFSESEPSLRPGK